MTEQIKQKLTVVVIVYNGARVISETIEATINQTYQAAEIIVVDDCSQDNSFEFIKNRFPEVTVYQTPHNAGPGAARNLGKKLANNPLVLFIDHDVVLKPGLLAELLSARENYPAYSIFVPRIYYYHTSEIIQDDGIDMHYLGLSLLSRNNGKTSKEASCQYAEGFAFAGKCYLVDLSRCRKAASYDEIFYYTFEDLDYALTNARFGNRALLVPSAEALHRTGTTPGLSHTTGKSYPGKRLELLTRNRLLLISKHYDVKLLLKILPASLLFDLALFAFSILKNFQLLSFLRGYFSFFSLARHIIGYRNKMKAYPLSNEIYFKLRADLRIKPETFQGLITGSVFRVLNHFFIIYGKHILNIKEHHSQKMEPGKC
jgi:GT2 family glycosyltransferase